MSDVWQKTVVEAFQETMQRIAMFFPNILAMVSLLLLGIVAGWIAKVLLSRLLHALKFDKLCDRSGLSRTFSKGGVTRPGSELVGRLAFWTIFLLFSFMAVDALNLKATANFMTVVVGFLPHFLAALLLLFGGWLLADFFAEAALIGLVNAHVQDAALVANLIRWAVLLFTAAMVLTQLGIAREIVVATFSITFGGIVFALALAVGLGGRHIAKEALERRFLSKKPEAKDEDISHL